MKKQIAIVLILAVFLIGITGASLVSFFSNTIYGNVQVDGPVFYLQDDGSDKVLLLNEIPTSGREILFSEGDKILFVSDSLGLDEFYDAEFEIHVWARSKNNTGNYLHFRILKDEEEICSADSSTLTPSNFGERTASCYSEEGITWDTSDKISLEVSGVVAENSTITDFEIRVGIPNSKDEYSRVEVNKA